MKSIFFSFFIYVTALFILFSGSRSEGLSLEDAGLVGEYNCEEVLEDPDDYVGYYSMYIESDGRFSMYDAEAGNPGISGKMTLTSENTLSLNCNRADFDPPYEWKGMNPKCELKYELDGNKLYLIYSEDDIVSTFVFHKYS